MQVQILPDAPLKGTYSNYMQIPVKYLGAGSTPAKARLLPAKERALLCFGSSMAERAAVNRKMKVQFLSGTSTWPLLLIGQELWLSTKGCEFKSRRGHH